MKIHKTFTVECEAIHETRKAILIDIPGGDDEWIAKERISPDSEVQQAGDRGKLIMCAWLAQKIGWL